MTKNDINLALVERQFGESDDQVRFARFCNAVVLAEAKGPLPTLPRLDDSPGADGGFDGSWTLPKDPLAVNALPFAAPGWNAFQFKARNAALGPAKAFSSLKQSARGAAQALIARAGKPGEVSRYTLFTNLRLGRPEKSTKASGSLPSRRDELIATIREGLAASENIHVEIVEAGFLQAVVNRHPALRETFFGEQSFQTWDDAWSLLAKQPFTQPGAPLIGRTNELVLLQTKLADRAIGFIGISGASGMGKTRLALEATKDISARTFFVRAGAKAGFLSKHLGIYATTDRSIFVIEDLRFEEAKILAEQAVLHPGVCILASIPAEEHLPRLGLGESPAIFSLRLLPLNSNDSRALLQGAHAQLDHDAFEWVIQEAGGNPQVLLVAASLGRDLRKKAGLLRKRVAQSFLGKAAAILGAEVEPILELLSALSPFDVRKEAHVQAVQATFGLTADAAAIRRYRDRLVDAAFIETSGRGGHDLNVSPPLLAAYLVERALDGHPQRCLALYDRLDQSGRRRLLDRLVSVDSAEGHGLWKHVFGPTGPFVGQRGIEENQESLLILARAAPRQTAEFLQRRANDVLALLGRKKVKAPQTLAAILADTRGRSKHNQRIDGFRSTMHTILHELVDHRDSSRLALGLLEEIVTTDEDLGSGFAKVFTECFIAWNYRFPIHPVERWKIVARLCRGKRTKQRVVGFNALFEITDPPRMFGGQVVQRRRISEQQAHLTMGQVWDYIDQGMALHLATAAKAGPFRKLANEHVAGAVREIQRLPPARTMPLLRRIELLFWEKKITLEPGSYLACLMETRERFDEMWAKHATAEWAAGIPVFNVELDQMIARVQGGPIALRLTVWIDRQGSLGWEVVSGTKRHRYEFELEKLAAEIAAAPESFTPEVASILTSGRSTHGAEFAQYLGRLDHAKVFWPKIAALQARPSGAWIFGSYCDAIAEHDSQFVESQLEGAMPTAGAEMLMVLKKLGPKPAHRRRLLQLVRSARVTPAELVGMFQSGRWLDDLPVSEVHTILDYIARDRSPETTYELLQAFTLYLHQRKKLPRRLLPIAEAVLLRRAHHHQDTDFDSDHLAEHILNSNLAAGLALFRRLMTAATSAKWEERSWNPISGFKNTMDFYELVRSKRPKLVYEELFRYLGSKHRVDVLNHDSTPFDVEHHAAILLQLTKKEPERAAVVARNLRHEQPGFWAFIYSLLGQHPDDVRTRQALTNLFADDLPWGYLGGGKIDAGLQVINREFAQPSVPPHGRIFLEQVKAELLKRDTASMEPD